MGDKTISFLYCRIETVPSTKFATVEYVLQNLYNHHQNQQVRLTDISLIYQLHISYMNVYVKNILHAWKYWNYYTYHFSLRSILLLGKFTLSVKRIPIFNFFLYFMIMVVVAVLSGVVVVSCTCIMKCRYPINQLKLTTQE